VGRLSAVFIAVIAAGLSPAKMLAYASVLSPSDYGLYVLAVLASAIVIYAASAGMLDGVLYALSNTNDGAQISVGTIQSTALLFVSVGGCAYSTIAAWLVHKIGGGLAPTDDIVYVWAFLVSTVLVSYYLVILQAAGKSSLYFLLTSSKAALALAVVALPILSEWRFGDVVVLDTTANVVLIAFCVLLSDRPTYSGASARVAASLVRQGWTFNLSSATRNLAGNIDRLVLAPQVGMTSFGTYSFFGQICLVPQVIGNFIQVAYTAQMIQRVTNMQGTVLASALKAGLISFLLTVVVVLMANLEADRFIAVYMPQYSQQSGLLVPFSVAACFMAANQFEMLFRATNSGRVLLWIQILSAVATAAVVTIAVGFGVALDGVAWMFAICCGLTLVASAAAATYVVRRL